MGGLIAVVSKRGRNVLSEAFKMLGALEHRGGDAYGVAVNDSIKICESLRDIECCGLKSEAAIGYSFSRILQNDNPQPLEFSGGSFVFDGRLYPPVEIGWIRDVIGDEGPVKGAERILSKDGSFAFSIMFDDKILLGRDLFGLTPLYYGENEDVVAFASERKALWRIKVWNVDSFPPGHLLTVYRGRINLKPVNIIGKPEAERISVEEASLNIQRLLEESVEERVLDVGRVAVAFSGGLDSSVIAFTASKLNVDIELISVGLEGDTGGIEKIAESLNLPIHIESFTVDDVERDLFKVLWLIEEPDALKLSIAVPFFWVAEAARELGCRVLLLGQGSDELFGGYYRYLNDYRMHGEEGLRDTLYRDVILSYKVNFERDNKVCSYHKVEPRLPFIDLDLVKFSLHLPVNLKIESENDPLRKRILRETARRMGLPPEVYRMRKKAIQYQTGVFKSIRKIAGRYGMNLKDFVTSSFNKIFNL